jgi:predicted nucleic-acid-binding protein
MFKNITAPVLILTSPRTGSTALGRYIKNTCNIENISYFTEPQQIIEQYKLFKECIGKSKNYILKEHLYRFNREYSKSIVDAVLADSYKIRLYRKDFIKQVVSSYITYERNLRTQYVTADDLKISDTLDIKLTKLSCIIIDLKKWNDELVNSNIPFDLTVCYEDLELFDLNISGYYKTPQPLNYHELITVATELMHGLNIDPITKLGELNKN